MFLCTGLAIDWRRGRLLFTNEDSVILSGVAYSWQRIETVRLDGTGRRAIITADLHRPRGLALDTDTQSVYCCYTESVSNGLTSHSTRYRSFQGQFSQCQMT